MHDETMRQLKVTSRVTIETCESDIFFVTIGENGGEMLIGRRKLWKALSGIYPRAKRAPKAPKATTTRAPRRAPAPTSAQKEG